MNRLPQRMIYTIDIRPVAEEAIRRLELRMEPAELLDSLTVERVENTSLIDLSYEDANPERAQQIVNTVGEVSSEFFAESSRTFTATVYYEKVAVPTTP